MDELFGGVMDVRWDALPAGGMDLFPAAADDACAASAGGPSLHISRDRLDAGARGGESDDELGPPDLFFFRLTRSDQATRGLC